MSVATCQNVAKNSRPVVTKVPEPSMLPKQHTQRNNKKGTHKTKDEVNLKSLQHLVLVLKRTELHVRLYCTVRLQQHDDPLPAPLVTKVVADYSGKCCLECCLYADTPTTCHVGTIPRLHGWVLTRLAGQAAAVWSAIRMRPQACRKKNDHKEPSSAAFTRVYPVRL